MNVEHLHVDASMRARDPLALFWRCGGYSVFDLIEAAD
jgi:hypothetical protein